MEQRRSGRRELEFIEHCKTLWYTLEYDINPIRYKTELWPMLILSGTYQGHKGKNYLEPGSARARDGILVWGSPSIACAG